MNKYLQTDDESSACVDVVRNLHLASDATELEPAGGAGERYTPIFVPKVETMYREESTASEEESRGGN